MPMFAFVGSYTAETWANMTTDVAEREAGVRRLVEGMGGRLEAFYFMFGDDDILIVFEAPDDVTAGAIVVKAVSGGGLARGRTHRLFRPDEGSEMMRKVKG